MLSGRPYHRQRLHLVLAAMRRCAGELRKAGFLVVDAGWEGPPAQAEVVLGLQNGPDALRLVRADGSIGEVTILEATPAGVFEETVLETVPSWKFSPGVIDGRPVLVVAPKEPAPGRPWVWHGEFFGHKPAPDIALLKRGFHVVYMRVPNMLGAPAAVAHWDAFYEELTDKYRFAEKVALVGLSRGGLYCYNWAAANPDKVACIYGDAPVCDFKSWPGGKGKGKGSPRDWQLVLECYGFEDEADALAYKAIVKAALVQAYPGVEDF